LRPWIPLFLSLDTTTFEALDTTPDTKAGFPGYHFQKAGYHLGKKTGPFGQKSSLEGRNIETLGKWYPGLEKVVSRFRKSGIQVSGSLSGTLSGTFSGACFGDLFET